MNIDTVQLLQDWVERVQNAIRTLHELEAAGVIPKGTVRSPAEAPTRPIIRPHGPNRKAASDAPSPAAGTKRCNKCGQVKPLDEYPKHKECSDGHTGTCKACVAESGRARYRKAKGTRAPDREERAGKGPLPYSCEVCHAKF